MTRRAGVHAASGAMKSLAVTAPSVMAAIRRSWSARGMRSPYLHFSTALREQPMRRAISASVIEFNFMYSRRVMVATIPQIGEFCQAQYTPPWGMAERCG